MLVWPVVTCVCNPYTAPGPNICVSGRSGDSLMAISHLRLLSASPHGYSQADESRSAPFRLMLSKASCGSRHCAHMPRLDTHCVRLGHASISSHRNRSTARRPPLAAARVDGDRVSMTTSAHNANACMAGRNVCVQSIYRAWTEYLRIWSLRGLLDGHFPPLAV